MPSNISHKRAMLVLLPESYVREEKGFPNFIGRQFISIINAIVISKVFGNDGLSNSSKIVRDLIDSVIPIPDIKFLRVDELIS
jgi:hypothetical protein